MCALFHDVGEVLNHVNHGEIGESDADDGQMSKDSGGGKEGLVIGNKSAAASLLRPYISEQNYWVLQHHEVIIMMISTLPLRCSTIMRSLTGIISLMVPIYYLYAT